MAGRASDVEHENLVLLAFRVCNGDLRRVHYGHGIATSDWGLLEVLYVSRAITSKPRYLTIVFDADN